MSKHTIKIDGRTIELSNLDKVLFPKSGITKGDLIEYYQKIADTVLPHLKNRMITMHRFPDGIAQTGFFQREVPDYYPDWIATHHSPGKPEPVTSPVISNAATLVYLANQAVITPHTWLSRVDKLDTPDRLIFDLDPSNDDTDTIRDVARALRNELEKMELPCFIQTSGSRGYHIVVPLKRQHSFDEVRTLASHIADTIADQNELATTAKREEKRDQAVYIDVQRNTYAQSAVSPYAVRPKEGAPIATPIEWDELVEVEPQSFTINNIFRRLARKQDPWHDIDDHAASLTNVRKKLNQE